MSCKPRTIQPIPPPRPGLGTRSSPKNAHSSCQMSGPSVSACNWRHRSDGHPGPGEYAVWQRHPAAGRRRFAGTARLGHETRQQISCLHDTMGGSGQGKTGIMGRSPLLYRQETAFRLDQGSTTELQRRLPSDICEKGKSTLPMFGHDYVDSVAPSFPSAHCPLYQAIIPPNPLELSRSQQLLL